MNCTNTAKNLSYVSYWEAAYWSILLVAGTWDTHILRHTGMFHRNGLFSRSKFVWKMGVFCGKIARNGYLFSENSLTCIPIFGKITPRYGYEFWATGGTSLTNPKLSTPPAGKVRQNINKENLDCMKRKIVDKSQNNIASVNVMIVFVIFVWSFDAFVVGALLTFMKLFVSLHVSKVEGWNAFCCYVQHFVFFDILVVGGLFLGCWNYVVALLIK